MPVPISSLDCICGFEKYLIATLVDKKKEEGLDSPAEKGKGIAASRWAGLALLGPAFASLSWLRRWSPETCDCVGWPASPCHRPLFVVLCVIWSPEQKR